MEPSTATHQLQEKAGEQNPLLLPASGALGQKTNLTSEFSTGFCPQSHLWVKCQALSIILMQTQLHALADGLAVPVPSLT